MSCSCLYHLIALIDFFQPNVVGIVFHMHQFLTSIIMIWSLAFFQPEVVGTVLWHYRDRHVMLLSATHVVCQAIPVIVHVFFVTSIMSCSCLYHLFAWFDLTNLIFQPNVVGIVFQGMQEAFPYSYIVFACVALNGMQHLRIYQKKMKVHNFQRFFQLYTFVKFLLF